MLVVSSNIFCLAADTIEEICNKCENINECYDGLHICHKNAQCSDTNGSYTCECEPDYIDTYGDGSNCIHTCNEGQNECHENALCNEYLGELKCECEEGFSGDGKNCVDIKFANVVVEILVENWRQILLGTV